MIIQHGAQCRHQFGVILQGFAHPHHHNIRDNPFITLQVLAQEMLCIPQLSNDFTGFKVPAEALVPSRTKTAAHGTTGLRRNTQGSAIFLRNKNGLNRIAATDVKQPLDRTVRRNVLRNQIGRLDLRGNLQLLAQGLGKIAHVIKVGCAFLMNPAKQLNGAIALLTQLFAKNSQTIKVVIKQIGRHQITYRVYTFMLGKKKAISTAAVSAASEPCTALASMLSAKSARMVPGAAFLGSVAPIRSRFFSTAFSPSSA